MASDGKISLLHPHQNSEDPANDEAEDAAPPARGVRAQNRRQKLFFVLGTLILTVLIAGGVRYYMHSVRPLRVAAGPVGTRRIQIRRKARRNCRREYH